MAFPKLFEVKHSFLNPTDTITMDLRSHTLHKMSFSGRCESVLSCLFIRDESRSLRQYNDSEAGDKIVALYFLFETSTGPITSF